MLDLYYITLMALLMTGELAWGLWRKRPVHKCHDTLANLVLFGTSIGAAIALTPLLVAPFSFAYEHRVADISPGWAALLALLIVWDFVLYWTHRIAHRFPFWWADHAPHHSSGLVNVTTGGRQSPTFLLTGRWVPLLIIPFLGFHPSMWVVAMIIQQCWAIFQHLNPAPNLGPLDWVMATPRNHHLHHAANEPYANSNYGEVLIIWDRIFGTYRTWDPDNPPVFAPTVHAETGNPLTIAFYQWGVFLSDGAKWIRRHLTRVAATGIAAFTIAGLLAAQPLAAQETEPSLNLSGGACSFQIPRGEVARCGRLAVPQNYGDPQGKTHSLNVAVFEPIAGGARDEPLGEPLILIPGGPGGHYVIDQAFWADTVLLRQHRSLIVMDLRGTGLSFPSLHCPEIDPSGPPAAIEAAAAACRTRLEAKGIDLNGMSTDANVRDLIALRKALGLDRWRVMGTSYGGYVALRLLDQDGDAMTSLILDSPLTEWTRLSTPALVEHVVASWQKILEACAGQPSCKRAYPDLGAELTALSKRLADTPLALTDLSERTGNRIHIYESQVAVLERLKLHVSFSEFHEGLPHLIGALNNGKPMAAILQAMEGRLFADNALGTHFSIVCREGWPIAKRAAFDRAIKEAAPYLKPGNVTGVWDNACPAWIRTDAPPKPIKPSTYDVPMLLLSGEFDNQTNPADHDALMKNFPNGQLIRFPWTGHAVRQAVSCVDSMIDRFLADPKATVKTDCADRLGPPTFLTGP